MVAHFACGGLRRAGGWLLLGAGLVGGPASAQTPRLDSLRQLVRDHPQLDTVRLNRLNRLVLELSTADAPQATALGHQALTLTRRLHNPTAEGKALLRLSNLYRRQAAYEPARRCAQQARRLFARQKDHQGLGRTGLQLSLIDLMQGSPVPALAAALQGLHEAEQAHDQQTQMRLQATMGDIYYQLGNYPEALPVLRAALAKGQRMGDHQLVLQALNGLGNALQKLRNYPQALAYYQRALLLSQRLGDHVGETDNETSLAEVYGLLGQQPQALAHGLRARQLVQAGHDGYNLPSVELMLARAYLLARQPDSALALAQHSLQLSQRARSNENIRNASDLLAQASAQRGDFAEAYRYRNLQIAYDDTLSGEDTQRRTSALRYGYELAKKQAQIVLLEKNRQLQAQKAARQRWQLLGLLAGLVGVVLIVALLLRNIFLKQRANRRLNEKNNEIATHRDTLGRTLTELQATQNQLVQREKMASLGELTAGVAHEIQNPLNFVTNFSELSGELVAELSDELAQEPLPEARRRTLDELLQALTQNQAKISEHSHRADRIVKSMLEHSRASTGQRQATNLNALADECLRLAYHGWRAKHKEFNATLTTQLAPGLPPVSAVGQDLSRVLLNLLTNAFYAVAKKSQQATPAYRPEVCVQTRLCGTAVQVQVRDNGTGIPAALREKIFQPFFTTKPTGEGTGLGLSLSYDIITKGHGGTLTVESQEGEFTLFTITLPAA